jgi:hypothetical protein
MVLRGEEFGHGFFSSCVVVFRGVICAGILMRTHFSKRVKKRSGGGELLLCSALLCCVGLACVCVYVFFCGFSHLLEDRECERECDCERDGDADATTGSDTGKTRGWAHRQKAEARS